MREPGLSGITRDSVQRLPTGVRRRAGTGRAPGAALIPKMDGRELCAVMLAGRVDVDLRGEGRLHLGSRANVFDGPPDALYLPPDQEASFAAAGGGAEGRHSGGDYPGRVILRSPTCCGRPG